MFAMQVALMKGQGGVFTSLFHYARMWDNVSVPSICLYRGPGAGALRAEGIKVVDAPSSFTSPLFALTPSFLKLRRQIHAFGGNDPDCVMVHSDLALRTVRRMFPSAIIIARCHSDKTKRKRDADIVITLNPDQHDRVTRQLTGSRARALMLGHPFTMDPKPPPVAAEGPTRINYVARFVAEKDPLTFARAAALLSTRPRPTVRLIGDGPLHGDVKRVLETVGAKAEFTGWRSRPFDDFSRNDILVLPSTWEGLPWLLLEAQALGVPIIASDHPGNTLALGNGAYGDIFPMGNAEALAKMLDAALADLRPLRARAERGRADLPLRFGPQAFWTRLQDAMRPILDSK